MGAKNSKLITPPSVWRYKMGRSPNVVPDGGVNLGDKHPQMSKFTNPNGLMGDRHPEQDEELKRRLTFADHKEWRRYLRSNLQGPPHQPQAGAVGTGLGVDTQAELLARLATLGIRAFVARWPGAQVLLVSE